MFESRFYHSQTANKISTLTHTHTKIHTDSHWTFKWKCFYASILSFGNWISYGIFAIENVFKIEWESEGKSFIKCAHFPLADLNMNRFQAMFNFIVERTKKIQKKNPVKYKLNYNKNDRKKEKKKCGVKNKKKNTHHITQFM